IRSLLVCNRTVSRRGVRHGAGRRASTLPAYAKMPRSAMGVLMRRWGAGPALSTHRHSSTDAGNSHRARRVALACEIVGEDCITRSKTARGAIADPDFHLPRENKNVLSPGRGVPIAEIVRRETAEHEIGTRPKRNVMALLGRQREIFKMGLAVVARIYPYDHARAPSHREIIVHAKATPRYRRRRNSASLLRTLPPDVCRKRFSPLRLRVQKLTNPDASSYP